MAVSPTLIGVSPTYATPTSSPQALDSTDVRPRATRAGASQPSAVVWSTVGSVSGYITIARYAVYHPPTPHSQDSPPHTSAPTCAGALSRVLRTSELLGR